MKHFKPIEKNPHPVTESIKCEKDRKCTHDKRSAFGFVPWIFFFLDLNESCGSAVNM